SFPHSSPSRPGGPSSKSLTRPSPLPPARGRLAPGITGHTRSGRRCSSDLWEVNGGRRLEDSDAGSRLPSRAAGGSGSSPSPTSCSHRPLVASAPPLSVEPSRAAAVSSLHDGEVLVHGRGEMSYMRGDRLTMMRKLVKGLAKPAPTWLKVMEKSFCIPQFCDKYREVGSSQCTLILEMNPEDEAEEAEQMVCTLLGLILLIFR
ncbi:unnamed protein product, partial [Urochloa humidicola]